MVCQLVRRQWLVLSLVVIFLPYLLFFLMDRIFAIVNHVLPLAPFAIIEELKEIIVFIKGYGWLKLIIRLLSLLNPDLKSQLISRVKYFVELEEGNREATGFLINKWLIIFSYIVYHFKSHLEFWRSISLTNEEVFRIALVHPHIFNVSKERKLKLKIEFLEQCKMNARGHLQVSDQGPSLHKPFLPRQPPKEVGIPCEDQLQVSN